MQHDLALLFDRELASLEAELARYSDDEAPWRAVPGQPNSAGTLILHLCGNLRHFVGAVLGGSGYLRDREAEFARRGVSRADLAAEIALARREVAAAFATMSGTTLEATYPIVVGRDVRTTTQRFLLHLLSHLAYHLGQIDYARRAATGDPSSAGVQPMPAIAIEA